MKKETPWIVIDTDGKSKDGGARCARCGEFRKFRVPVSIPEMVKQIRVFNEYHASCEESE